MPISALGAGSFAAVANCSFSDRGCPDSNADQAIGAVSMLAYCTIGAVGMGSVGVAASKVTAISSAFISPQVIAQKIVSNFAMSASWLCVAIP